MAARNGGIISGIERFTGGERQRAIVAGLDEILQEATLLRIDLIEVHAPQHFHRMVAKVTAFYDESLDLMCDSEIPLLDVGSGEIWIYYAISGRRTRARVEVSLKGGRNRERRRGERGQTLTNDGGLIGDTDVCAQAGC